MGRNRSSGSRSETDRHSPSTSAFIINLSDLEDGRRRYSVYDALEERMPADPVPESGRRRSSYAVNVVGTGPDGAPGVEEYQAIPADDHKRSDKWHLYQKIEGGWKAVSDNQDMILGWVKAVATAAQATGYAMQAFPATKEAGQIVQAGGAVAALTGNAVQAGQFAYSATQARTDEEWRHDVGGAARHAAVAAAGVAAAVTPLIPGVDQNGAQAAFAVVSAAVDQGRPSNRQRADAEERLDQSGYAQHPNVADYWGAQAASANAPQASDVAYAPAETGGMSFAAVSYAGPSRTLTAISEVEPHDTARASGSMTDQGEPQVPGWNPGFSMTPHQGSQGLRRRESSVVPPEQAPHMRGGHGTAGRHSKKSGRAK
ncbi:hypothetical protein [Streptomyces sp. NPDC004134]|uniref:hypothetical protein n=1 Tax=Streptomyces sp. NPDC004134 TaxID=3364691 RepID=UPI0036A0F276